jgi:hypothetical protein
MPQKQMEFPSPYHIPTPQQSFQHPHQQPPSQPHSPFLSSIKPVGATASPASPFSPRGAPFTSGPAHPPASPRGPGATPASGPNSPALPPRKLKTQLSFSSPAKNEQSDLLVISLGFIRAFLQLPPPHIKWNIGISGSIDPYVTAHVEVRTNLACSPLFPILPSPFRADFLDWFRMNAERLRRHKFLAPDGSSAQKTDLSKTTALFH